jgi:hypothetical protein
LYKLLDEVINAAAIAGCSAAPDAATAATAATVAVAAAGAAAAGGAAATASNSIENPRTVMICVKNQSSNHSGYCTCFDFTYLSASFIANACEFKYNCAEKCGLPSFHFLSRFCLLAFQSVSLFACCCCFQKKFFVVVHKRTHHFLPQKLPSGGKVSPQSTAV